LSSIFKSRESDPGVLRFLASPLAAELPEKYNSVVWIRQRKEHLALANINWAMVFQACIGGDWADVVRRLI
jgi:hypothetical protein